MYSFETQLDVFHLLVYSPNAFSSWEWPRIKEPKTPFGFVQDLDPSLIEIAHAVSDGAQRKATELEAET